MAWVLHRSPARRLRWPTGLTLAKGRGRYKRRMLMTREWFRPARFGVMLAAGWLLTSPRPAAAQGCVAARMDTPIPGQGQVIQGVAHTWDITTSFRHFKSD